MWPPGRDTWGEAVGDGVRPALPSLGKCWGCPVSGACLTASLAFKPVFNPIWFLCEVMETQKACGPCRAHRLAPKQLGWLLELPARARQGQNTNHARGRNYLQRLWPWGEASGDELHDFTAFIQPK